MADSYRDKIAASMKVEAQSAGKARKVGDAVPNIGFLTIGWLTDAMCRNVPAAKVTAFQVHPHSSGTHTRHRIELTYNEAGREAQLPTSAFAKTLPTLDQRAMSGAAAVLESYFYNQIRPSLDIEAPRCFASTVIRPSFATIHLLEDVVKDKGAAFADYRLYVSREMAEDIVFLLASLHSHFLDKSQLVCHEAGLPRFSRQFPVMWKVGNIERYTRESLVASGGRIPSRLMKRVDDIWPATVASLELHRGDELTIIHSDVHIGNWYKTNTNAMGLADWQFVVIGHWARDLSYALATALVPEDRRNWERDLVKLYIDKLSVRSGKNFKFQQAWLYYRQQMLSALAMWTGVLRHDDTLPDMQPEDMSLAMIERIAAAIDDLDVIDSIVI